MIRAVPSKHQTPESNSRHRIYLIDRLHGRNTAFGNGTGELSLAENPKEKSNSSHGADYHTKCHVHRLAQRHRERYFDGCSNYGHASCRVTSWSETINSVFEATPSIVTRC